MKKKLVKRVIEEIYKQRQENPFTVEELSRLKPVMKTKRGWLFKIRKKGIFCRIELYKDGGIRLQLFDNS